LPSALSDFGYDALRALPAARISRISTARIWLSHAISRTSILYALRSSHIATAITLAMVSRTGIDALGASMNASKQRRRKLAAMKGQNQLPKMIKGATFREVSRSSRKPRPPLIQAVTKITHTSKGEPSHADIAFVDERWIAISTFSSPPTMLGCLHILR